MLNGSMAIIATRLAISSIAMAVTAVIGLEEGFGLELAIAWIHGC